MSMVVVACMSRDLQMQKGKIAAQCSHAAVGLSYNLFASSDKQHQLLYHHWTAQAAPKIVVKVPDEAALMAIQAKAEKAGVHTCMQAPCAHSLRLRRLLTCCCAVQIWSSMRGVRKSLRTAKRCWLSVLLLPQLSIPSPRPWTCCKRCFR